MSESEELEKLLESGMSLSDARAFQKQKQRDKDEEDLKSGKISREDLSKQNSMFYGIKTRIRWDKIRKF
jgi:hypothetical protein